MPDTPTTDAVLEAATQLGQLLAAHPAYAAFSDVMARLEKDLDAQRLVNDLRRHQQATADKERSGQPIEVADKHKLRDFQAAAAGNALLREMQTAEMDYVDLMRQVDAKITPR